MHRGFQIRKQNFVCMSRINLLVNAVTEDLLISISHESVKDLSTNPLRRMLKSNCRSLFVGRLNIGDELMMSSILVLRVIRLQDLALCKRDERVNSLASLIMLR